MTIQEFLDQFSAQATKIVNNINTFVDFISQKGRAHKTMREEHIPIRAFILHAKVPLDARLELGGEAHDFDAKIRTEDVQGTRERVLEVVQAIPKDEHVVRNAIATGTMNLENRMLEIEQIHSFPQPIIDAINKKNGRGYADKRTLLVAVSGEHTCENDDLIKEWMLKIKRETVLGSFEEIFLVETARYKIYKIH